MEYLNVSSYSNRDIGSQLSKLADTHIIHRIWYSSCAAGSQTTREFNYSALIECELKPKPKQDGI